MKENCASETELLRMQSLLEITILSAIFDVILLYVVAVELIFREFYFMSRAQQL